MKKLLFIFSFLFCVIISFAQTFPNNNLNNSNPATLFGYQGGLTSNGYKLKQFADTATANLALYLKFTPHLMIKVGNNIYVRNTAATQWVLVGGNFILNPGVDSVTLYGNTLCQWVSGVSTCYALNNSSFSNYAVRGDFIYDSLLYFHNTAYQYYILGRYFTAPYTSHLLTPPNPSAARNDAAYVDTLSSAGIITGVNGGGVPSTNPVSQFKIGEIHINAADTVPSNFSNEIAYRFDNEWSPTSAITGFTSAYATDPFTGTSVSMYVPSFVDGETISLLNDTLLDISNASYLKVRVWLGSAFTAANLNFSFNSLGNVASTSVPLLNGQFGYTSTVVGSWQEINIPMAYFQLFSYSIDEIIIGTTGANASGFKIGNVVIQFGGLPTSSAVGGIQSVNANFGPHVILPITDTGYVDSDTSNYIYKDKRTNTVLFTLPTFLKNLVSTRTAADTCIVLDTLGRTIFISLNPYCMGSGGSQYAEDTTKIPLAGTAVGKPVTGDIEINTNIDRVKIYEKVGVTGSYNGIVWNSGDFWIQGSNSAGTLVSTVQPTPSAIIITSSDPTSRGLIGAEDYTANITDLDFTQKKYVDSVVAAGGGITTASNGLTLTGSDVTLGGTLTGNTTIATGSFGTTFSTATSLIDPLKAIATNGIAVKGTATNGTGVYGTVTSGIGVFGVATTGVAVYGSNTATGNPSVLGYKTTAATNTVLPVFQAGRHTSGTPANGIGASIDYLLHTSIGDLFSNKLISKLTDVTGATYTSQFVLEGVNSAVAADLLTISGNGATQLNKYGIGTFTGTPAYTLQVDASGNVIEGSAAGGVAWGAITGTLSDQTDLNTALGLKAPLASPTFTGTVTIPTPFTLGATSVTSTGTQLNYLNAATGTTGTASTNLVFSTSPTLLTPTFTTNATVPLVIGGTATTSTLTLQSTSGSGTTGSDIIFKDDNTEYMRILNSGVTKIQGNTANTTRSDWAVNLGGSLSVTVAGVGSDAFGFYAATVLKIYMAGSGLIATVGKGFFGAPTALTAPTALLQIGAGTAAASTAPYKETAGTLLTVIEPLVHESNASGGYRSTVALNRYAEGGAIKNFITTVDNGTTIETDLYTYTTKANTLVADGETITFKLAGTFNDITATAQLQFYFGGTNIGNTGTLTVSATGGWNADVMIIRTGSTTARAIVTVNTPGASTALYTTQTDITGLTLSGTNIIKVTGTAGGASGGSGDISAKLGTIFWWGAANN